MKFDFSSLEFVTIENVNIYSPVIYVGANSITFGRGALDILNYPAYVHFMIDVKNRVFAVRACKSGESRAFKFTKPKEEQKATVCLSSKSMLDPVLKCIGEPISKGQRFKVMGFWVAEAKTLCFDLSEAVLEKCASRYTDKEA